MESMQSVQAERSILTRTALARQQAERLLEGLMEAKANSERRLAELRQTDHLKHVTGRSSLENAIASTRRMIDTIDRTLGQFRREPAACEVVVVRDALVRVGAR